MESGAYGRKVLVGFKLRDPLPTAESKESPSIRLKTLQSFGGSSSSLVNQTRLLEVEGEAEGLRGKAREMQEADA